MSLNKKGILRIHKAIKRLYDTDIWSLSDQSDYYGEMRAYTTWEITNSIYKALYEIQEKHEEIRIWYHE